ncbi:hypothetical protein ACSBR2_013176 [Camellia fascicularis]
MPPLVYFYALRTRNLDQVRKLKSAMTRLTARVQKVRDELEQLLDDDDDMANLYLSRKLAGASSLVSGSGVANWCPASPTTSSKKSRASRARVATFRGDENDVEGLEMLLEAYFMQIDGTLNKLTTLREYIDDTEDYINIQLDNHRNQLIQLELLLTSAGISVSLCSTMAGIFGANIPFTGNSNHGYMFKWVVIVTVAFCTCIFILIISYARYKGLYGSDFRIHYWFINHAISVNHVFEGLQCWSLDLVISNANLVSLPSSTSRYGHDMIVGAPISEFESRCEPNLLSTKLKNLPNLP